jgi:hypothetical protein
MVGSWILKQNLESFLEMLTYIAGYPFNDWDFDAIAHGINGTDGEHDRWFQYEFRGTKRSVSFFVADDPGSSVYLFRITVPDDAVETVDLAYFVAEGNDLKRHNSFKQ